MELTDYVQTSLMKMGKLIVLLTGLLIFLLQSNDGHDRQTKQISTRITKPDTCLFKLLKTQ